MNNAEKMDKLARMPKDYRPTRPLEFVGIDIDKAEGFLMLEDAEAGQVVKRLFDYAQAYSVTYDPDMLPYTDGLSFPAAFVLRMCCSSFRRMEDKRREVSYLRSGANDGGRPRQDT